MSLFDREYMRDVPGEELYADRIPLDDDYDYIDEDLAVIPPVPGCGVGSHTMADPLGLRWLAVGCDGHLILHTGEGCIFCGLAVWTNVPVVIGDGDEDDG